MWQVPVAMAGAGVVSNLLGANAQANSIEAQIAAQNRINQQLRRDLKGVYGDAERKTVGAYAPYTDLAGQGIAGLQQDYSVNVPDFQYDKTVSDFLDPSIAYQQDQARRTIESGAAASNSLLSGAAQKALSDRAQQIGEQGFADAYQRMIADRNFQYGKGKDTYQMKVEEAKRKYGQYGDLANIGLGAVDKTARAYQDFASNYGANLAGTAPQSSAGTSGMVWGQTAGNLGSGLIDLAGKMIPTK